jgi:hypothetical protein
VVDMAAAVEEIIAAVVDRAVAVEGDKTPTLKGEERRMMSPATVE